MPVPCLLALALILLIVRPPSTALAQGADGPALVGEVVRVTSVEGRQVVGTVTALADGALRVTVAPLDRSRTFAFADIRGLERRVTVDRDVKQGALWGAGLGLAVGGVAGGVLAHGICSSQDCERVGIIMGLGAVGAAGGAAIGALIGASSSTTMWEIVPLDRLFGLDLSIGWQRGIALSARLALPRSPRS